MLTLLAAAAVGYLLGAIPTAELAARLKGRRIFEVGSGNMGAMNTARNLGWALGAGVLLIDLAKGAAATYLGMRIAAFMGLDARTALLVTLVAGVGAVVGHAWSVFVGFRGGKGLATILGASLPLYPLAGLAGLVLLLALLLIMRQATPASLLTLALYPLLVGLVSLRLGHGTDHAFSLFTGTVPLALVSIAKHLWPRKPGDDDAKPDGDRVSP